MSKYDDIIDHPHYQSNKRPHMSMLDRAAQFSPFAALTGYDDSVKETARLTQSRIDLTEDEIGIINNKLKYIEEMIDSSPSVTVTYFAEDEFKEGGQYLTITECVKKIDPYQNLLLLCDGTKINLTDIFDLDF